MKYYIVFICFMLSLRSRRIEGILHGQEADPHSMPYQVFFESFSTERVSCGGSLISQSYILTAATCVYWAFSPINITLGAHNFKTNESTQLRLVITRDDVTVHPDFDGQRNNLALINLPEEVALNDNINIVALTKPTDDTYVDEVGRVSGWGPVEHFSHEMSDVLRYIDVKVTTNGECAEHNNIVLNTNFCTSAEEESGPCEHDIGGPFIINDELVGVVSFTGYFCESWIPKGYTRIANYLDWIAGNSDVIVYI